MPKESDELVMRFDTAESLWALLDDPSDEELMARREDERDAKAPGLWRKMKRRVESRGTKVCGPLGR